MSNGQCETYERMMQREARGEELCADEREEIADHLDRCADCRLVSRTLELAAFDGTSAPAPAQDDLSRRRWVDTAVSRALADDRSVPDERASRRRWRPIAVAAAAVVLVACGIAIYVSVDTGVSEQPRVPTAQRPLAEVTGKLLLAAGEVRVGGNGFTLGGELADGTTATVGDGRAAFELGPGVGLLAEAGTAIQLVEVSDRAVEVRLVEGRVVLQVDPDRDGPEVAVATSAGRVVVTGTAFAVDDDGERVEVQVFRGRVRLDDAAAGQLAVPVGRGAVFGAGETFELSGESTAAALGVLSVLALLDMDGAARLEVGSAPGGATVEIDGSVMGRSPVVASVRPGNRTLELSLEGYNPVVETIELSAGGEWSVEHELQRPEIAETEPERAADVAAATKGAAPKGSGGPDDADAQPAVERLGPEELLERAQMHRAAKQWSAAAGAYEELIRSYPGRAEARSALVSLGNIQLDHLRRPGAALRSFDSYLRARKSGPLAQEAAYGRAVAFRAMGNKRAEADALRAFLQRFPTAIQAGQARERLSRLE